MVNFTKAGILGLVLFSIGAWGMYAWWQFHLLKMVVCDVGQGDGLIFSRGFTQVLVDGGPDDSFIQCVRQVMPLFDSTIELVIATHADADHITGLASVLQLYQVKTVLTPAWGRPTETYKNFLKAIIYSEKFHHTKVIGPSLRRDWDFGGDLWLKEISPEVDWGNPKLFYTTNTETLLSAYLASQSGDKRATNDGSIGAILHYKQWSVLLTADMELAAETAAIRAGLIPDVNVIKVGHHGAKTSSSLGLLEVSRPELAVISVGRNNRYHHPDSRVISVFKSLSIPVLRTDQSGTIVILSDGSRYGQTKCWLDFFGTRLLRACIEFASRLHLARPNSRTRGDGVDGWLCDYTA